MSGVTFGAPSTFGTGDVSSGGDFTGASGGGGSGFDFGAPSTFSNPGSFSGGGLSPSFFSQSSPQVQTGGGDGQDFSFSDYLGSALRPLAQGAGQAIAGLGRSAGQVVANAPPQDLAGRLRRQSSDQLRNPTFDRRFAGRSVDGRFFRLASADGGETPAQSGIVPGVPNGALLFGAVALVGAVMLARG